MCVVASVILTSQQHYNLVQATTLYCCNCGTSVVGAGRAAALPTTTSWLCWWSLRLQYTSGSGGPRDEEARNNPPEHYDSAGVLLAYMGTIVLSGAL